MAQESKISNSETRCPVCENMNSTHFGKKNDYLFLQCPECKYIFCYPRPTKKQLSDFYSGGATGTTTKDGTYSKVSSRKRRGFFNALKLMRYFFAKRALDVGCGGGFVVGAMKTLGAREAVGIDLNPSAVSYAKKHYPLGQFYHGSFAELFDETKGFNFVYSSEVIEHVEDVEEYARFLQSALVPGGVLFITTPDIESNQVPDDATEWDVFSPPQHIQFFNQHNLIILLRRFGLSPIKRVKDRGGAGLKMLFRYDGH